MENMSNNLKKISKLLLVIALHDVLNLVMYGISLTSFDTSAMDEMSQMMMPTLKLMGMIPFVVSILVYVFLCFKGHQEANDPSSAKFHIILALIWMIGCVISTLSSVADLVGGVSLMKIINLLFTAAAVVLLFLYRKYAKEIRIEE